MVRAAPNRSPVSAAPGMPGLFWVTAELPVPPSTAAVIPTHPASLAEPTLKPGAPMAIAWA